MRNPGYLMMSFFLPCAFYKIRRTDEEIGWAVGLTFGTLALILNHHWPGGYRGLALHGAGRFVLLTICKVLRGWTARSEPGEQRSETNRAEDHHDRGNAATE